MDFDKRRPVKREIENLDSCYLNFEPEEPKDPAMARKNILLSNRREVMQCECGP
jgi:hypothetical protein